MTDTTDVLRGTKAGRSALEKVMGVYPFAGLERALAAGICSYGQVICTGLQPGTTTG
ncbi:MAG: hypothetical protein AAF530_02210 [Pseudomonadota bacterium]